MIKWVITSLALHLLLLGAGWSYTRNPHVWKKPPMIYQVELVRRPMQKAAPAEKASVPVTAPEEEETVQPAQKKSVQPEPPPPEKKPESRAIASEDTVKRNRSTAAQIRVQGQTFPYQYYLKRLHRKIEENWRPPSDQAGTPGPLSATVRFRILRNGRIETIVLERSAGHFTYDQAAQRTIYNLGNMPPLPPEFEGEYLNLHIEFETLR